MKTILFQGDSVTDCGRGDGVSNKSLGGGYPAMVASRLKCDYPDAGFEFINRGVSGNRVVDLYARWKIDCLNLNPDIVSILIGVNDTWHEFGCGNGVEVPRYERIYREMISWTADKLPGCTVMLMTPFMLPVGDDRPEMIPDVAKRQEVVEMLANEFSLRCVPVHAIMEAACEKADPSYWAADGVHPTPAGHQLIADAWIKTALPVLFP